MVMSIASATEMVQMHSQAPAVSPKLSADVAYSSHDQAYLHDLAFHRTLNGGAALSVEWSERIKTDVKEIDDNTIQVIFYDASISSDWISNIDTSFFNTVVNTMDIERSEDNVVITLHAGDAVSFRRKETSQRFEVFVNKRQSAVNDFNVYEPITINFQGTPLRTFLQTLADFAGFNLVVSDSVGGNVSLQLRNVPWEEVMNITLLSKGLGRKQIGSILYIAPIAEIAAQEAAEAQARTVTEDSAPLEFAFIPLNYATAASVTTILMSNTISVLSSRGSISTDTRTNTLVISDTADHLRRIRDMVERIDTPVDQVLIESRIVEVAKGSAFDLGIQYTGSDARNPANNFSILPAFISGDAPGSTNIALSFTRLFGGIDLDMEISALESENQAQLVSSPHLLVSDNTEAYIKSGKEVPYRQSTASGAASVAFKEAVLELLVTPQIAPNGYVILDVTVKKDGVSNASVGEEPILDKREIKTKLMVKSGETIVLGGIYETDKARARTQVPLLGDIPLLGWLFGSTAIRNESKELLIFITPKIIEQTRN